MLPFSHFTPSTVRDLDRLESLRAVVLWLIMSTGVITAYLRWESM